MVLISSSRFEEVKRRLREMADALAYTEESHLVEELEEIDKLLVPATDER